MSCAHCPQTEEVLDLDTPLYYGFGGYHVEKDGKLFYRMEDDDATCWTVNEVEVHAKREPVADWKIILNNPLRGATWKRKNDGQWVLIEKNQGFA